jgi:tetratricopeptide (TPR) repeat protein
MPKKIKIVTKKEKKPDEFISTSSLIIGYVKNHYQTVARSAIAVGIAMVIVTGWFYYSRGREKEAALLFLQVQQLYQKGETKEQSAAERYRISLGKFEDIINRHKGTSAALNALFYKGECLYRLKEYNKATENYEQFINQSRKGNYLRGFAFEGLGYCHEAQGDYTQALNYFEKAVGEGEAMLRESGYLSIARCYEALNDRVRALEFYKKVADTQEASLPVVELAQDKIKALKD